MQSGSSVAQAPLTPAETQAAKVVAQAPFTGLLTAPAASGAVPDRFVRALQTQIGADVSAADVRVPLTVPGTTIYAVVTRGLTCTRVTHTGRTGSVGCSSTKAGEIPKPIASTDLGDDGQVTISGLVPDVIKEVKLSTTGTATGAPVALKHNAFSVEVPNGEYTLSWVDASGQPDAIHIHKV